MKKRLSYVISVVFMAVILTLALTACETGGVASVGGGAASTAETSEETASEEVPEIPVVIGEAVADVGDFTVTVPEGWMGVPDLSVDENEDYYFETYCYTIVKGGESIDDLYVKPSLTVYYCSDSDAQTLYDDNITYVDESTELDITAGGQKCPAYHYVNRYEAEEEGGEPIVMEYDNVFIPISDTSCFRVSMLTNYSASGETGVNVSDEGVIAIMDSLKVK